MREREKHTAARETPAVAQQGASDVLQERNQRMIGLGEVMLDFLLAEISAVRLERPENPFKIMPPFGRYDGGRRDGIVVPAILRKHIGRGSAQPPGQGRAVSFPRGNVRPQRQQPFEQREGSVRLLRGGIFCKEDPAVRCKLRIMAAAAYRGHNRNVQNGHAPIVAAGGRVFHEIDIRALVDQVVRNLKIVRFYRDLQRRLAVVLFFGGCFAVQLTSSGFFSMSRLTSSRLPLRMALNKTFISRYPASA